MNILIINSSKKWGGNERWSLTTTNALAEKGHAVHFISRSSIFEDKLNKNIYIHKLKLDHEFAFGDYLKLINILRKYKIQVIIPTKRKEYWIAGIIGKMLNIPVCFRLGIVRSIRKYKIVQRFIYGKLPAGIICNSQQIKQQLINDNIIAEEKIHVVYNGYSFPEIPKDWYRQMYNRFVFASAGRLTSQKGYDVLLEAVNILRRQEPNFIVKIAGEGPELEHYQEYIQSNGLQEYIKFDGFVDNIRKYFAQSDVVLIPSRNEGIPNVLMEAWSVKKPVIASKSAGIPEAVKDGHSGILVSLDSAELAAAMKSIMLDYEKFTNLGSQGFKTLTTKFTLEKSTRDLEIIFNNRVL